MSEPEGLKTNPWLDANLLQRLVHSWVYPLIKLGNQKDLEKTDLYKCIPEYSAQHLGGRLEKEWQKELGKPCKPSLLKAIVRANSFHIILFICLALFQNCILRIVQPLLLGEIVRYFTNDRTDSETSLDIATCLALLWLTSIFFSYVGNFVLNGGTQIGIRVRIGCSYLMYNKALRLSTSALGDTTMGQIVNLMSNNFNRFELTGRFLPYVVASPLHLVITGLILYELMGAPTIAGTCVFLVQLVFQVMMGKAIARFRSKTSIITDERVRILNESVTAMKVIKMYTWEGNMVGKVEATRKKEISKQLLQSTMTGLASDVSHLFGKIALFVTILVFYLVNGVTVTPFDLFVSMSFFENLRFSFRLFSFSITYLADAMTTIRRFQTFLQLEDKGAICGGDNAGNAPPHSSACIIDLENITAKWSSKNNVVALSGITLRVLEGELLGVIGPVGSGKTSLLQSLMGELHIVDGRVRVQGKTAYVPQEAWLHTGSIKDNVRLFSNISEAKYKEILYTCTLNRDIELMDQGDRTLVGEKGALLSGGQKARVNLARALCSNADIYLLDDPLSAVDASVGKKLFNNCIKQYLYGKTRILITHQVQYLKHMDRIIVMKDGKCMAVGTYEELTQRGFKLEMLVKNDDTQHERRQSHGGSFSKKRSSLKKASIVNASEIGNITINEMDTNNAEDEDDATPIERKNTKTKGKTMKSLWQYLNSGGGIPAIIAILLFAIMAQAFFNGTDIYLSLWSQARDCPVNATTSNVLKLHYLQSKAEHCISFLKTKDAYFYLYIVVISCLLVIWIGRSVVFYTVTNLAAKNIHVKVIRRLFYAPIEFFDTNSSGKILNRVTKDMGNVDDVLPYILCETLMVTMLELGFLVVIVYYYVIMIVPAVIFIVMCVLLGYFYIKPGRDLQKLDSSCSSPVYSHLASTIQGLQTIRSFGGEKRFQNSFCQLLDLQTSATVINTNSSAFYRSSIEIGCVIFLTCVHVMIYYSPNSNANAAGLALSSCLQIAMALQYVALLVLNTVSLLVSVERVLEYKKLPNEQLYDKTRLGQPILDKKAKDDIDNWPSEGAISFKDVSLYYDINKPPSLNKINLEIKPRETIGIVGRTGAGKSSIIAALLRLREPDGLIFIDDVPTKEVSLGHLRSKISVIPQDPVLFSGPLRLSLDPYGKWPDFKLWRALKQVELDTTVGQLADGLDTILVDGGNNFSVGQRQLLCLARTILLNNKILVLDEATANIDPRTDSIIQESIKKNLNNCTTLTVAHRIDTIIDCDKVMVLDAGELVEYDEPYKLLLDEKSSFTALVSQTGASTMDYLVQRAKDAYLMRQSSYLQEATSAARRSRWSISDSVL